MNQLIQLQRKTLNAEVDGLERQAVSAQIARTKFFFFVRILSVFSIQEATEPVVAWLA